MIRHSDAEHIDGGHAANVRYPWRKTFNVLALAVCEDTFGRLGPVKSQIVILRPPVYMIQFCRPGVDIRSWNDNMGIVSVLGHQISSSDSVEICRIDYIRRWANANR